MLDQVSKEIFADECQVTKDYIEDPEENRKGLLEAVKKGLAVFEPLPNELQLDIDIWEETQQFENNKGIVLRSFPESVFLSTKSKGGNDHIRVLLGKGVVLNSFERVAWQVLLGSDPNREAFNLRRLHYAIVSPIVLFETAEQAIVIQKWLESHYKA